MGTARKIPAVIAWGRMFLAIASVLLIVSSLLFAVVWLVRAYVLSANIPALSLRGWPAATSVCILAAFSMLVVAQTNVIGMGKLTAYTGGYWLMTLFYAALAIYSVFHVLLNRDKRAQVKPLVWWHSGAVVAANFVVVAYLGYYGMIGLRFWAY